MEEKIKEIIVQKLLVNENEVTEDALLKEDLGADSLDLVDLAMALEDEFEIQVSDDDLLDIKTVGDIITYLNNATE